MEGSNSVEFVKEVCNLKHQTLDNDISEVKESVDDIIHPTTGRIALAIAEQDKKIDKLEAKLNGLIIFLGTTITGAAISIGAEFIKKFVN